MAAPPAVSAIFFVRVRTPQQMDDADRPWTRKLLEFDYLGMLLLLPSITCLILALELGGARYGWSNGRTIGCFVAAGVLFAAFTAEQWWMGERALVPPRIIRLRIVLFASLYSYCLESAFLTLVYYVSNPHSCLESPVPDRFSGQDSLMVPSHPRHECRAVRCALPSAVYRIHHCHIW